MLRQTRGKQAIHYKYRDGKVELYNSNITNLKNQL